MGAFLSTQILVLSNRNETDSRREWQKTTIVQMEAICAMESSDIESKFSERQKKLVFIHTYTLFWH